MDSPRRKTTLDTVLNRITLLALAVLLGGFIAALWITHDWGTFLKTLATVVVLWVVIAIAAALILGDTDKHPRLPAIEMVAVAWDEGFAAGDAYTRGARARGTHPNDPDPRRANPYRKHTTDTTP